MSLTKDMVASALTRVEAPGAGGNIVDAGAVEKIAVCDTHVSVRVAGAGLDGAARAQVMQHATAAVRLMCQNEGLEPAAVHVEFTGAAPGEDGARVSLPQAGEAKKREPTSQAPQDGAASLPGVGRVIAVGAGKGGVGKSTVAVNLAVGLAREGRTVGLLDGDIYGPSLPTMLGLSAAEAQVHEKMVQPFVTSGIRAMTIGKLVDPERPLIWRGPMAHGAFKQLLEQTRWGELDDLVIDLPPGTGDVVLSMAQMVRLTGAVIVCTPQRVAQDDAVRAARMFQQLGVEILGVVENMSYFIGDDGKEYDLFGRGGAEMMAQRLGLPFLGAVPINTQLRANGDAGEPEANFDPDRSDARLVGALENMVRRTGEQAALAQMRGSQNAPTLSIS